MKLQAYIKKLPNGKYRVYSESGKNLGTYPSLAKAKNHLKRVEFFKHSNGGISENLMEVLAGLISGCGLHPTETEIDEIVASENISKVDLLSALSWLQNENGPK